MHFYLAAVEPLYSNAVVDGTGPVWLQQVACNSTDTRLFNCARGSLGALTCGHDQDAGVNCTVLVNCSELPLILGTSRSREVASFRGGSL